MAQEVGSIRPQSNLISNHFNMHLEIEKIKKEALWISRINSGAKELGVTYSSLINAMKKNNILINRKILSDIAINDVSTFEKVVKTALK